MSDVLAYIKEHWMIFLVIVLAIGLVIMWRGKTGMGILGGADDEDNDSNDDLSFKFTGGGSMMTIFTQEPWFTEIKEGRKSVEARVGPSGRFEDLVGKKIKIKAGKDKVKAMVTGVRHYDNLSDYVKKEGYKKVAPHTKSDADAVKKYLEIKNKAGEVIFNDDIVKEKGGIIAIEFTVVQ